MEVKEDLSDIWKEEDPDYTQEKSMGRQAEKGMSSGSYVVAFF
jgi:hypothetical protein